MGGRMVEQHVAPRVPHLAPELTTSFVREALDRAIHGVEPLAPAAETADKLLAERRGAVNAAVRDVIDTHVRYAGAQGLLTGLGGVLTAAVTIPANIAGLALIQARMVAGIAHLRGYDLDDPRVRNAILACMLGEELVDGLVRERKLPAPPMAIATAPVHDPDLDRVLVGRGRLRAGHPGRRQAAGDHRRPAGADRRRRRSGWASTASRPGGSGATPRASCAAGTPVGLEQRRGRRGRPAAGARASRASGTSGAGRTAPGRLGVEQLAARGAPRAAAAGRSPAAAP